MKKVLAISAAVAIVAMAGSAFAGAAGTNQLPTDLGVSATVDNVCYASKVLDIAFGTIDPVSATGQLTATPGKLNVKCTKGTVYTFSVPSTTTIANGSNTIAYTPVLPTTVSGTVIGTDYNISATVEQVAYQAVPAGTYTGALTVTVNY